MLGFRDLRLAHHLSSGLLLFACAEASASPLYGSSSPDCGVAICTASGVRSELRVLRRPDHTLIALWQDGRAVDPGTYVSAMTADGQSLWTAPDGTFVGVDSLSARTLSVCAVNPDLLALGSSGIGLHTDVPWVEFLGIPPSGSAGGESITIELLPERPWGQSIQAVLPQDSDHVIAVVTRSNGAGEVVLRRVAIGDTLQAPWPDGGVVLRDSVDVGMTAQGVCSDGLGGCFVALSEFHTCEPIPFQPCPTELRLFHVTVSGALDSSWPSNGVQLSTDATGDQWARVCPDGAGGAFAAWYETTNDTVRAVAQHVDASGDLASGWNPVPTRLFRSNGYYETGLMIATGAAGELIAFAATEGNNLAVVVQISPTGQVSAGWPEGGVGLNPPTCCAGQYAVPLSLKSCEDGTVLVAWRNFNYGTLNNELRVAAIANSGVPAPGWPAGGAILCVLVQGLTFPEAQIIPLDDGTFSVIWMDHRSGSTGIYDGHYNVLDASVPALGTASLVSRAVQGRTVRIQWALDPGGIEGLVGLRSYGAEPLGAWSGLRRTGSATAQMLDTIPLGVVRASYAVGRQSGSTIIPISQVAVLELPASEAERTPAIRCAAVQHGGSLGFDLVGMGSASQVRVTAFDIVGRRLSERALDGPIADQVHVTLPVTGVRSGLLVLQARASDGRSVSRRVVVAP